MRFLAYFIIIPIFVFTGCKRSDKPAENEIQKNQTKSPEERSAEAGAADLPLHHDSPPERLKENRSVDKKDPPVVLDIVAARKVLKNFTFKELGKKIRYIPIRFPEEPDTIWSDSEEFDFLLTPHNIIASNYIYGVVRFDRNGEFLNNIVKNEFYYSVFAEKNFTAISEEDRQHFRGSLGEVYAYGDQIFYLYIDNPDHKGMIMSYDASPARIPARRGQNVNEQDGFAPAGEKILTYPHHEKSMALVTSLSIPVITGTMLPVNREVWASVTGKPDFSRSGKFLVTLSGPGDTICAFTDHDPVKNYAGPDFSDNDNGSIYSYNGVQYIRQAYNDTVYEIRNANRLIPRYIIDFGEKGVRSATEGIDRNLDRKNKFLVKDILETDPYLFIRYTEGSKRYNGCIYNKATGELFHVFMDIEPVRMPWRNWNEKLIGYLVNDIDQGLYCWPRKVTGTGTLYSWFNGRDLKYIVPELEKNGTQVADPMKKMIGRMQNDDYLLMVLE